MKYLNILVLATASVAFIGCSSSKAMNEYKPQDKIQVGKIKISGISGAVTPSVIESIKIRQEAYLKTNGAI